LHNGHPPNKKQEIDCCVTPETEAHALLVVNGNWNRWHAQFQTADTCPNHKRKSLHIWPSHEVTQASDKIKERLQREQHNTDEPTDLPEGWLAAMRLQFEGAIPADERAEMPNQVSTFLGVLVAVHWSFAHLSTPFCPLFFWVFLSEVEKDGTDKTEHWAAACGDIFKNPFADGCSGQQHFSGLTKPGLKQHNKHLADVKEERKDPTKCKFEKDFMT